MGMTLDEAIEHGKEQLEIFGGEHKEFIETSIEIMRKYQQIEKLFDDPSIISDSAYSTLTKIVDIMFDVNKKREVNDENVDSKANMVAMLTELKQEIAIMSDTVVEDKTITITSWKGMQMRICKHIQSKINALKADRSKEDDNT